ncbi:MAG TPA: carboxymuconolactone decarboxylase family protein [Paracoccaceae bacterium]|nr:carboxymuconolactone decarboxylase family protein [Paracoccaceae bacterium]
MSKADWPQDIADMQTGFAGRLNVYRVMAHHPALMRAWAPLRAHVVQDNALGAQRSEVVILRTGHRAGAAYEWAHHISRARACGMSDARIASIAGPLDGMAPEDAVIAGAVDALVDKHHLPEAERDALQALVGTAGVFDVMATVGFYSTLAFIVKTFGTPLDADVAAELDARPLAP